MPTWPKWNVEHECQVPPAGAPRVAGVVNSANGKVIWGMPLDEYDAFIEPLFFCPTCGEKLPRVVKITVEDVT